MSLRMGQIVTYGTLLHSCSYNTLALSQTLLFHTLIERDISQLKYQIKKNWLKASVLT